MRSQWYDEVCECAAVGFFVAAFTADVVHFHCKPMARCSSLTSVLFLACGGGSGCPRCHPATQRHVWAAAGEGASASPGLPLLLRGGAPVGLGSGPWKAWSRSGWGPANDWSTLAVLRSTAGGVGGWWSLRFWSRDLRKPVYSGRGGRAGLPHKNACVMTGAAERRNALHNPNTVGARPGLMWQPFLIYFSSFCPHSPALSVARHIPGKNVKLHFYLWLRVPCSQPRLFQRGWNVTENLHLSSNDLFIYSRRRNLLFPIFTPEVPTKI